MAAQETEGFVMSKINLLSIVLVEHCTVLCSAPHFLGPYTAYHSAGTGLQSLWNCVALAEVRQRFPSLPWQAATPASQVPGQLMGLGDKAL